MPPKVAPPQQPPPHPPPPPPPPWPLCANCTITGDDKPTGMFPFMLSTIHLAWEASANRTNAALSDLPGWFGRTFTWDTLPYCPNSAKTRSSLKSIGSPATNKLSWTNPPLPNPPPPQPPQPPQPPKAAPPPQPQPTPPPCWYIIPPPPKAVPPWKPPMPPATDMAPVAPVQAVASYFRRCGLKRHSKVTGEPTINAVPSKS
mmetsp:Transcript_17635/g.50213  ORF Transcript_17635/g.50213 Transcript_17635/m.50213 type:complete len:202 (+) Transcript_17635:421-1026(+)